MIQVKENLAYLALGIIIFFVGLFGIGYCLYKLHHIVDSQKCMSNGSKQNRNLPADVPRERCLECSEQLHLKEIELARTRDCQIVLKDVLQALEETADSLDKCTAGE